ncbi:MAG TPA: SDR family oxidoreductase [Ferruginibacter sp.]|nr:SDR family oxidoreductase [Ferruginibacter sp.]HRN79964.1 SDR family oxidoreductase [Ferruginibacter sp.]HRO18044.1 SDR family oxidoreductase [Ferruginibacter sp.]HRQ21177.1 SDR family oxidoreductase [Ferruginibacter sp.]
MNVIITGASRGIGYAIAQHFAKEGCRLLLCASNQVNLELAVNAIHKAYPKTEVLYYVANLSEVSEVKAFGAWCLQYGAPDILVNNAGKFEPGNCMDEAEGQMDAMMRINFYSAYHLTRALLPSMIQAGRGHIFNMCSIASLHAYPGGGSYSISKHALHGFSLNLRHELKTKGIKVTAVYPGAVFTDSWVGFDNSTGRIMEAEDIAALVVATSQLSPQATVEQLVVRPQLGDL